MHIRYLHLHVVGQCKLHADGLQLDIYVYIII